MSLIDKEQFINEMNTRAEEEALDFRDIRNMVEFTPTVKAVSLDKVKQAREEIEDNLFVAYGEYDNPQSYYTVVEVKDVLKILDKLIESEGNND